MGQGAPTQSYAQKMNQSMQGMDPTSQSLMYATGIPEIFNMIGGYPAMGQQPPSAPSTMNSGLPTASAPPPVAPPQGGTMTPPSPPPPPQAPSTGYQPSYAPWSWQNQVIGNMSGLDPSLRQYYNNPAPASGGGFGMLGFHPQQYFGY
jgi:hypothetical protein